MSRPSVWWPLPVAAERWFNDEERAVAERYHLPIERSVRWSVAAQIGLMSVAVLASIGAEWGSATRIGAILAAIAGPRLVVDAWREFVHEPRFDAGDVSLVAFAATFTGRMLAEGGALAVADWWLRSVDAGVSFVVPVTLAAAVPVGSTMVGPRVVLAMHRAVDVPSESPAARRVAELAALHAMNTPRVVELDQAAFDGVNAFATGTGGSVTVALSKRLTGAPSDLFSHVVAHELAHLRRRHLWWSAAASGLALANITVVALVVGAAVDDTSARLGAVVLSASVASVPFRLGLAWLSRAHERQADADALGTNSISPASIKQLHLIDRGPIELSRTASLFSGHPAPAERLERVARSRTPQETPSV